MGGAAQFERVLDDAHGHLRQEIVGEFTALAVHDPQSHDADVFGAVGDNQPEGIAFLAVVVRVGRAHEDGALAQLDGHIIFQFDGSGQVAAHLENQFAATLLADEIDGLLDGGGIQRGTVRLDAEHGRIIIFGRGGNGNGQTKYGNN